MTGALLAALFAGAVADEPSFTSGDVRDLKCEVATREAAGPWSERLAIDVRNGARVAAEPLVFTVRVTPKGKKAAPIERTIARAAFPLAHRFGRPTPPGGKARYWLQIAKPEEGARVEAAVAQASWFEGAVPQKPAFAIGRIETAPQRDLAGTAFDVAKLAIANPLPHAVDVVLLASFSQPKDAKALVGARVAAGATSEVVVTELRVELGFVYEEPHGPVRIEKAEVVDWCCVGNGPPDAGAAAFLPVYERWLRWPEPAPALRGRFAWSSLAPGADLAARGSFRLDAAGAVAIELDAGAKPELAKTLSDGARTMVEEALLDLRRAAPDALDRANVRLVGDGVVEVRGAGFWLGAKRGWRLSGSGGSDLEAPSFELRDGRIAGSGFTGRVGDERWTTEPLRDGWVVKRRQNASGQWSQEWSWTEVRGLPVPTAYRERFGMPGGGLLRDQQLSLSEVELDGEGPAIAPAPVAGEGAVALQAAWESGYHYPESRRDLSARFTVEQPGSDMVWAGARKVHGSLRLRGFRGFQLDASGWRECQVDVADEPLAATQRALAYALSDRLLLWTMRDWNGRAPFAEAFAGATIAAPDGEGRFAIEGAAWSRVVVRDGRLAELVRRDGSTQRLTWSKVGDDFVVTRVQSGEEDLKARFVRVGDRLVPTRLDFRAVFGKEWGPEAIELTDVRVE